MAMTMGRRFSETEMELIRRGRAVRVPDRVDVMAYQMGSYMDIPIMAIPDHSYDEIIYDHRTNTYRTRRQQEEINHLKEKLETKEANEKESLESIISYFYTTDHEQTKN